MRVNEMTGAIIDAAIEVHRVLGGPGLLESIYEEALAVELQLRGFKVQRQVPVPVVYKGSKLKESLRIDLLVEEEVVVECKATTRNSEAFAPQTVSYLRLRAKHVSLVINFGKRNIRQNVRRIVDHFDDDVLQAQQSRSAAVLFCGCAVLRQELHDDWFATPG